MVDFIEFLKNNVYPGRGILIGKDTVYYFIMGRSENSRNRIFAETEDGIETRAFDESKLEDPSLIIYHPVRRVKDGLIVTNGDQTDTIRDKMNEGHCTSGLHPPPQKTAGYFSAAVSPLNFQSGYMTRMLFL